MIPIVDPTPRCRSTRRAPWLGCLILVASAVCAACAETGDRGAAKGAAACDPGDPADERYGTSCLCCHTGDFTVAGSVDRAAPPARIIVVDRAGARAEMSPDPYGNFFRHVPLVPPLTATVIGIDGGSRVMPIAAPHADCNECHRPGGSAPRIATP